MSDVPIQIVDENDQPVGEATINEAQTKGLTVRVSRVMIEDGRGNVLLQKRTTNSPIYPDCWDNSAAGHVDAGETYGEAAARELAEEIGIKNVKLQEIGSYYSSGENNGRKLKRFNKVYRAMVPHDVKLNLQAEEVSDAQWFSIEKIKDLIKSHPDLLTDGVIDALERYY